MPGMPLTRKQLRFLGVFAVLLLAFYGALAFTPLERLVVIPFTKSLATISAAVLNAAFRQNVTTVGTVIQGNGFAVDIKTGCNAVEAMVLLAAAVIAFDAPWKWRVAGAIGGSLLLQIINIARIVSLFLLGRYRRDLFDLFHLAVWQSLMFGAAVMIFLVWTSRATRHAVASH